MEYLQEYSPLLQTIQVYLKFYIGYELMTNYFHVVSLALLGSY